MKISDTSPGKGRRGEEGGDVDLGSAVGVEETKTTLVTEVLRVL